MEFATLKVTPLHMDLFNKQYAYKLKGENGEITGELAKDMFGVSFSSELTNIASVGDLQSVTITATGVEETIELTNRLKDMLEWEDVLSISETQFKDKIQLEKDDFAVKSISNTSITAPTATARITGISRISPLLPITGRYCLTPKRERLYLKNPE